jgi:hypothetical protein
VIVPVHAAPSLESVRAHVKQRHPAFMAPRRIEIVSSPPACRSANCVAAERNQPKRWWMAATRLPST